MDRRMTRRTVAKGAGALAGVAAMGLLPGVAEAGSAPSTTPTEGSLYDRLGGFFPIAAVVDRFSDAVIVNPKLNQNPALKAWNETQAQTRLPGLKFAADPLDRGDCRWPLRVHRLAARRGSRRSPPHSRRVRRSRRRDRPRPRLLRRSRTREAGTGGRLPNQHVRCGDGRRIAAPRFTCRRRRHRVRVSCSRSLEGSRVRGKDRVHLRDRHGP